MFLINLTNFVFENETVSCKQKDLKRNEKKKKITKKQKNLNRNKTKNEIVTFKYVACVDKRFKISNDWLILWFFVYYTIIFIIHNMPKFLK